MGEQFVNVYRWEFHQSEALHAARHLEATSAAKGTSVAGWSVTIAAVSLFFRFISSAHQCTPLGQEKRAEINGFTFVRLRSLSLAPGIPSHCILRALHLCAHTHSGNVFSPGGCNVQLTWVGRLVVKLGFCGSISVQFSDVAELYEKLISCVPFWGFGTGFVSFDLMLFIPRYFKEQIRDVFTEEDFLLYRWEISKHGQKYF